jgi:histidine triad (HIT) family protein
MQLTAEQLAAIEEQKQHCPFCKIVKGEIPAQKVFEDNDFIAVLDINPGAQGHTLLIPKEHYPIMPLVPPETQNKIGTIIAQLSAALKKAVVSGRVEAFIANGAVAGQQSSHFLIHVIPADKQLFNIPGGETDKTRQADQLMRARFGATSKDALSKLIAENPELRRMIIDNPEELIKNLPSAPDLQKLFAGVDIMLLSQKLKEQDTPQAVKLNDEQLVAFINSKEKLKKLLTEEPEALEQAIESQPKLKAFFAGTSVPEVRQRYLGGIDNV